MRDETWMETKQNEAFMGFWASKKFRAKVRDIAKNKAGITMSRFIRQAIKKAVEEIEAEEKNKQ
jgi:hypothetical protein